MRGRIDHDASSLTTTTNPLMATDDRDTSTTAEQECGGCTLHDALAAPAAMERRAFLRAAGLALASFGLLGAGARDAAAMSVGDTSPLRAHTGDRKEEKRYPIPADDGVTIDKDNSVIIARVSGKVIAFSLACPHQNTALRWSADDHEFQCPKHKSHYRADGVFIEGRATRDMDRLAIRRDGAALVVDIDNLIQQDEHPDEWGKAFVAV
jgi:nitrite reductase/ring-hydroxylating ferredoxin subunit